MHNLHRGQAWEVAFFKSASQCCLTGTMWAVNDIKQAWHLTGWRLCRRGVATVHTCGCCLAAVSIAHDADSIEFPPCLYDSYR